jgi:hypothetical protein
VGVVVFITRRKSAAHSWRDKQSAHHTICSGCLPFERQGTRVTHLEPDRRMLKLSHHLGCILKLNVPQHRGDLPRIRQSSR